MDEWIWTGDFNTLRENFPVKELPWITPEVISFRHMVTNELRAIDFMVSNKPREEMKAMKRIKDEWTWRLSDHCPIGFKVKIKNEVIGKQIKVGKGACIQRNKMLADSEMKP